MATATEKRGLAGAATKLPTPRLKPARERITAISLNCEICDGAGYCERDDREFREWESLVYHAMQKGFSTVDARQYAIDNGGIQPVGPVEWQCDCCDGIGRLSLSSLTRRELRRLLESVHSEFHRRDAEARTA